MTDIISSQPEESVSATSEPLDLVTIGNVSIDLIKIEGNSYYKVPGGSAAAVATAANACNVKTGIYTRVGEDFPKKWYQELLERNINLEGVQKQKSSCRFEIKYDKRGKMLSFNEIFNVEDYLSVKDFPPLYKNAKYIHLSAAHPINQARFLTAKSLKSKISLALWPTYALEYTDSFIELLSRVDVLFCNNHEAKILAKKENIYDAVKALHKKGPRVIVLTKGAKGSAVYANNKFSLFPALRTSTLDRTGCGDSFAGGFLAEYIKSSDVEKAGWVGAAMSSFTLSKAGSWFPADVDKKKIETQIERAKKYSESNVKKGTLLDFF